MGLEDREYLRDEQRRYSGGGYSGGYSFGSNAPVCRKILIVTIAAYVLQILITRSWTESELREIRDRQISLLRDSMTTIGATEVETEQEIARIESMPLSPSIFGLPPRISVVQEWFQLEPNKVLRGQVWRLLTCAFLHSRDNPFHILFNMLFLWWFGPRLEQIYGSKEFLLFYLTSALVASAAFIALDLVIGDSTPMVGASGAVMGVTMLFAMHFPRHVMYLFFVIPVEMRWIVVLYVVLDLYPVLQSLGGGRITSNVAHAAHLGGLAFGYMYFHKRWRLSEKWNAIETWWKVKRRGFRVVRPDHSATSKTEDLQAQVDAILKKISEQGEASLTKAERRKLEEASRALRNRRHPS